MIPELIDAAFASANAVRHLLVKGQTDYVVDGGRIESRLSEHDTPAMEPIGGTGDTLTVLVMALLASGVGMTKAFQTGAQANLYLAVLANPSPVFGVAELLPFLPEALEK